MNDTATALFATPATLAEIDSARAVAVLIGGYDGSGNYGDIALLDAALTMLEPLDPALLLLPVLERTFLDREDDRRGEFTRPLPRALFFDPGEGLEDGLLPVPAPAGVAFGACYLYGGGYLNPAWGERRLAMLGAAEALLDAAGAEILRLSSGQQVDAAWLAGLPAGDAERLAAFELLGARDPESTAALSRAAGAGAAVLDSGDDAVGLLRRLPLGDAGADADRPLRLNFHVAEHTWVTERGGAIAGFYAELAAELGRRAGREAIVQPLIAYLDERVDERPAVERLRGACAARGVELLEPLALRPSGLAAAVPELRAATLTVSCSFHVALTSLLLGVPAALLRDNAYYEQKATGLAAAFELPPALSLRSSDDPAASAGAIATEVLDPERSAALRQRIGIAAGRQRELRAGVEADLLARVGRAAAGALAERLDDVSRRLRERAAEPAELLARLALLESDPDTPPPPPPAPVAPANGEAEARLAELLGSRSWRMTAPLRRIRGRVSRR